MLVKINSRGGNYLLNIGPDAKGVIPAPSVDILRQVGKWIAANGESIYATLPVPVFPYEIPWGMFTRKPGKLYLHVFDWQESVDLHGLANKIRKAYVLSTGEPVEYTRMYIPSLKQYRLKFLLPKAQPDPIDSVICLETEEDCVLLDSLDTL